MLGRLGLEVARLAGQEPLAGWTRSPSGSSTAVTGCWASQSISRPGCSSRSASAMANVAADVSEPDRRGDEQRPLGPLAARVHRDGRGHGGQANIAEEVVDLTGSRTCGKMAGALERSPSGAGGPRPRRPLRARADDGRLSPGSQAPDSGSAQNRRAASPGPFRLLSRSAFRGRSPVPSPRSPRSAWSSAARATLGEEESRNPGSRAASNGGCTWPSPRGCRWLLVEVVQAGRPRRARRTAGGSS